MDLYERLQASEQSRRLAWRVLQEIRLVLEILGDERIPREGEMNRFRAEGDFLVRAFQLRKRQKEAAKRGQSMGQSI